MTLTPTARFHIGLINRHWYKDTLQEFDISNNAFVSVSPFNISILKANSLPTNVNSANFGDWEGRIIGNSNNGNGNNSGINHGGNIDIMSVQNSVE
ncbi:422_t:CDS:2 [Funneliformis mosseae]|uniref:422_t:CDS:1 n=1 Tax=Funneliformis mosseae TaxID=27381 RepID=A0A9N9EIN1_FUNMO|nr:422_t:CDS:2 [Funneliformis mosseae]